MLCLIKACWVDQLTVVVILLGFLVESLKVSTWFGFEKSKWFISSIVG
jgi:hypothetical protein